ncbi:MAG: ATP-grasp domain-containing protein [Candidatus Omnitrophica bacterium]|nr:ATP-grasp domain-containing protein [Candidatus Omnitrophota bacterium]
MKKLKVLLVFDSPHAKPRGYDFNEEFKDEDNWYTESDVYRALLENGHTVRVLGLCNDIGVLLDEVKEFSPDVIFNLAEVFNQKSHLDKNVAGLFEMLDIPYTGSSAESLFICNDKALAKKILRFHRIRVPRFHTFYRKHKVWLPKYIKLPVIVKPLSEEASRGISLASVVDKEEALIERVRFIHENMNADAIAEEYIEGREMYVSIFGTRRLKVLPLREMKFGKMSEDEPRIATYKAKWDDKYREKWDIKSVFIGKLSGDLEERIKETCKRAYRALNIQSYARFDIRVTENGRIYIIEPNANPCIARCDEVAQSAEKIGIQYNALIQKIISLAFQQLK